MVIDRPYRRTSRQLIDGSYARGGNGNYVFHPKFATSPHHYLRAFEVLQKDFLELLDYIEPADQNLLCYSHRTHELLMRSCIEIEANFKAIFRDNGFKPKKPDIKTFKRIEVSHRLSAYKVKLPTWHGEVSERQPFASWAEENEPLRWYQAYNCAKHDRHERFQEANFGSVVDAMCGLAALWAAQFRNEDFLPASRITLENHRTDGFETIAGRYFLVSYPLDWPEDERYKFNWQELREEDNPFRRFDYR